MKATILKPGLQTSLQARPRRGFRHQGMPWAGAADPVAMAAANWLVGNPASAPVLEQTYGGLTLRFDQPALVGLAGAPCALTLDGQGVAFARSFQVSGGQVLETGAPKTGLRTYLAVAGGWQAAALLGSVSTYMPAGIGGLWGRACQAGDVLGWAGTGSHPGARALPDRLRPYFSDSWTLRATVSAETDWLDPCSRAALFSQVFGVSRHSDRMGLRLTGSALVLRRRAEIPSAAMFPGMLQCPPDGAPIVLMADAQTTGGYPRIAQIARCDRHLLGQIRPTDRLRLLLRSPDQAVSAWTAKQDLLRQWMPDLDLY